MSKEIFQIYRLDELLFGDTNWRTAESVQHTITEICNGFTEVRVTPSKIKGVNIQLFHKKNPLKYWIFDFIKGILPQEEKNIRRKRYSTSNNNDIIFFYDDNFSYFYAITAGGGYRKLSNYFDEDFPINMLKKNFWGGFRIAQSRNISWSTYSEEQVFKSFYNFNQVEAFWKIFKKLGGKLNPESSLYRHFQNHNSINAQITEVWIRVSYWLTITEIVDLIKQLENIYMNEDLTPEQEILFRFIDSLKRFRSKDKNEKYLKQFFIYNIYPLLNNSELREDEIDVNFCSPNDVSDFFSADSYVLSCGRREWRFETYDIMPFIQAIQPTFSGLNFDQAFNLRKQFTINITSTGEVGYERKYNFFECIHGEFFAEDIQKYIFVLEGKCYVLWTSFQTFLENEVISILSNNGISIIPFGIPDNMLTDKEEIFNRYQIDHGMQCGDQIFYKNIELFDLLYEQQDCLYIIHIKKKFGAKIRDVCSQIEIAAKCIEQDIKDSPNDPACLRGLYDQIINYDGDLPYRLFFREQIGSFESFRDMFKNKRRVYVVGIINNENITRENIGHYSSKIARYELVSTWNNFKKNYGDSSLKICFIHPNS